MAQSASSALPGEEGPYKLLYFNFPGRAETIRLTFVYAGLPFEDARFESKDWPAVRATTPLGQVPVLYFGDGQVLTQSAAILHLVGARAGLYPREPLAAARVDEVLEVAADVVAPFTLTARGVPEELKKSLREQHVATRLPALLGFFEQRLQAGPFVAGPALTVADLAVFTLVNSLTSGVFDYVPASVLEAFPAIRAHNGRVAALPRIAEHLEAQKKK